MINRAAPLTAPDVALIWGLPIATAVAKPELLIVPRVLSDEVRDTEAVTSAVLPSLKVPIAVNCCEDPAATEGLADLIWIDVNVLGGGGGGVEDCEPQPALPATMAAAIRTTAIREIVNNL